jgi:hypothetical protein
MSIPLKFSKVYHRDGGPARPVTEHGPRILASKPVRRMLGALQRISDKKQLERKKRW